MLLLDIKQFVIDKIAGGDSITHIAHISGLSVSVISRIASSKSVPDLRTIKKILSAYGYVLCIAREVEMPVDEQAITNAQIQSQCGDKARYGTRQKAVKQCNWLIKKTGNKGYTVYRCEYCKSWHIGRFGKR